MSRNLTVKARDVFVLVYNWMLHGAAEVYCSRISSPSIEGLTFCVLIKCPWIYVLMINRGVLTWKCICSTYTAYQSGRGMQLQAPTHLSCKLQEQYQLLFCFVYVCCFTIHYVRLIWRFSCWEMFPFFPSYLVYSVSVSLGLEPVNNLLYDVNKLQNYFAIIYYVMSLMCEKNVMYYYL